MTTALRGSSCGEKASHARASVALARLDLTDAMLAPLAFLFALASPFDRPPADSVRSDRDIRLAALRHVADVKRCYEKEGLARNPTLAGTFEVTVTVLATGVVSDASAATDDMRGLGAREVAKCLTTAIRNWRFERGPYVVETIVFPFRFSPIQTDDRRIISS